MIDLGSVYRGLQSMTDLATLLEYWNICWELWDFWLHLWTPTWHKGRGPYVSLSFGWIKIFRGY